MRLKNVGIGVAGLLAVGALLLVTELGLRADSSSQSNSLSVTISPKTLTVKIGETVSFSASGTVNSNTASVVLAPTGIYDGNNEPLPLQIGTNVTASGVASVSGVFTQSATVTDPDDSSRSATDFATLTVVKVDSVTVDKTRDCSDETYTFTATLSPASTITDVTWTVTPDTLTVTKNGLTCTVEPKGYTGVFTAKAECGTSSQQASATSVDVDTVNGGTTICVGDTVTLTATPTEGADFPKAPQWTIESGDATFTNGNTGATVTVKPNKSGEVKVKATSGAYDNGAVATITAVKVGSVTASSTTIKPGESVTFTAVPDPANATFPHDPDWTVESGNVTGNPTGATYTVTAAQDFEGTITVRAKCDSSDTGASASVTVQKALKCKDRARDQSKMVTISVPEELKSTTEKLAKVLEAVPIVDEAKVSFEVTSISAEWGKVCCCPDDEVDPTEFWKISGSTGIKASITLRAPNSKVKISKEGTFPVTYDIFFLLEAGPKFEISPSGKFTMTGEKYAQAMQCTSGTKAGEWACKTCMSGDVTVDVTIEGTIGGSAKAHVKIFEEGHWYSIDTKAGVEFRGGGTTGIAATGKYDLCGGGFSGSACFKGLDLFVRLSTQIIDANVEWSYTWKGFLKPWGKNCE